MKLGIDIERTQWSEPFLEVVYNCGLNIVEKHKAEILVKAASDITEEDLSGGQKIIALEKTSGGNIAFREILQHPSVIRYVKSFNYNSFQLHNLPCIDKRLFTTLLPHDSAERCYPNSLIDESDFIKIRLGWSILHYFRLRDLLSLDKQELLKIDNDRPIDVFFAGTLEYDNLNGRRKSADMITNHRINCVDMLESIKGLEIFVVRGKFLSLDDYNQILCHSKVVVSPWGWGEPCYRDFEALLAGCVLVKPKTAFVTSACGIFENNHCTWTEPDFSDLSENIFDALKTFKASQQRRMNSREAIVHCSNQLSSIIKSNLTI